MTSSMNPDGDLGSEYLQKRAAAIAEENDPVKWLERRAAQAGAGVRKELVIDVAGPGSGYRDAPAGQGEDPSSRAVTAEGAPAPIGDVAPGAGRRIARSIGAVVSDVAKGVAVEGAHAVARGALEGTEQLFRTADDLAAWANENVVDSRIGDAAAADANNPAKYIADNAAAWKEAFNEPETNTGKIIGVVSQFLTGGAIVGKLATAAKIPQTRATRILKDFFTGAAAFDPDQARLADLVQEHAPNLLTDYLTAKDDDGVLEKRLKAGLENAGLGAAVEGVIRSLRYLKAQRRASQAEAAQSAAEQPAVSFRVPDGELKAQADRLLAGEATEAPVQVNMGRFQGTSDYLAAIKNIAETLPPAETIAMDTTLAQAKAMGITVEQLEKGLAGGIFDRRQISAGWMLFASMTEETQRLALQARSGAPADLAQFYAAYEQTAAVLRIVKGQSSEIARALQIQNAVRQAQPDMVKNFQAMLEQNGGADQFLAMAERMASMTPAQAREMVRQGAGSTTRDKIAYAYANTLLSNPASLVANVGDTGAATLGSVVETWVASKMGGGVLPGEASARLFGILWSFASGFRMAARAVATGESAFGAASRFEGKGVASSSRDLAAGEGRRLGDYLAMLIPTRLMMAGDELTKNMNYWGEMAQLAFRKAKQEGLEGPAVAEQIGRWLANPPDWLRAAGEEQAVRGTFNQQLGPMMARFSAMVDKADIKGVPVGRLLFPFIRTPANLERWVFHRTPVAYLSDAVESDLRAGGAAADLARARIVTGTAMASLIAGYVMGGNITGAGPKDPTLRAALLRTGWQPYSIRTSANGAWYSYSRSGTYGMLIGHVADGVELMSGVYTRDPKAIDLDGNPVEDGMAAALVLPFVSAVKDKTMLQSFSNLVDAMSDPHAKGDQFFQRFGASFVPAGVGAIERATDPELRRSQGYIEAMQARIPGLSEALPPRLNLWGEEVRDENGIYNIFLPVRVSEEKGTAIDRELVRMRLAVSPPRRVQSFGQAGIDLSIELSPTQHNEMIRLAGNELKLANPNGGAPIGARDLLDAIVEGKAGAMGRMYQAAGDERRELIIRSVLTKYREAAKMALLRGDEDLRELVQEQLQQRGDKLRAPRAAEPGATARMPRIQ